MRNSAGASNSTSFLYIYPRITEDPVNVNLSSGTNATLTCQAEAFPDPTYLWTYSNGTSIMIDNVEGIDSDTLQFLPAQFGSEGYYVCTANANNFTVISEVATLSGKTFGILHLCS